MKKNLVIAIFYWIVFLCLFIQFPLHDSLPGKVDNWFFIQAFNTLHNTIESFINGTNIGNALYPENSIFPFDSYSFGQAFIYLPLKWLGFNEINIFYLHYTFIFTLNSLGAFLLAKAFRLNLFFAFIAGLFFSLNNFVLGQLENPDALFLGIGLIGLYYFLKHLKSNQLKHVLIAYSLLALEIYFSAYGFLFLCLAALIAGLFFFEKLISFRGLKNNLLGLLLFGIILFPFLKFYIFSQSLQSGYNPANILDNIKNVGLKFSDFKKVLPNNLIYSTPNFMNYDWLYKTKAIFLGLTLPLLALYGLLKTKYIEARLLGLWLLIFFILAIGPFTPMNNSLDPGPLYVLFKKLNLNYFLRINIRAYYVCVLSLVLLASLTLQSITNKRGGIILSIFLITIILIENVPYKFEYYNSKELIKAAHVPYSFEASDVILNLPSSFLSGVHPELKPVCEASLSINYEFENIREFLYMYEQTKHKANTINGFVGFIPDSRLSNQLKIQRVTDGDNLAQLISMNHISHIILHKNFFEPCNSDNLATYLDQSALLEKQMETSKKVVYTIKTN